MTAPAWSTLIRELLAAGKSLREIGRGASWSTSSLQRALSDSSYQPLFDNGQRLIEFHRASLAQPQAPTGPARTQTHGRWGREDLPDEDLASPVI